MALTLQILNAGSTGAATPTGTTQFIYPSSGTTVAGKTALVKNVMLTNVSGITLTVEVKVRLQAEAGATRYYCSPKGMQIAAGAQVILDNEISLYLAAAIPDAIQITVTGTATNNIEWVVNGMLRDI